MLQETYGGQFEVGTVRWQWSGRISVDSIILKTDETSSAASDVITVNSASINFSSPIPIFNREIAGAINDQFFSIDITGELFNPIVAIVPLPFLSPQDN